MSQQSSIEWTDATWNPVRGCTKISPGCTHCYAETFAERWRGIKDHPYEQGFDLRLVPEKLAEPLKWKKPRMIFVNSMSDLFHEDVPFDYIDKVFAVMAFQYQHTYQVLTKRAERLLWYVTTDGRENRIIAAGKELGLGLEFQRVRMFDLPLPNVWLGVSVENQKYADERIPYLLKTPATVRFLSCEPLLGPLEFSDVTRRTDGVSQLGKKALNGIDWVIVGGESGHGARTCNVQWIRSIVEQCKAADIPVFVKQLGSCVQDGGTKSWGITDRKGGNIDNFPVDLRVREMPKVKATVGV